MKVLWNVISNYNLLTLRKGVHPRSYERASIRSVGKLYEQKLRFSGEEILPQNCSTDACLSFQPASLPYTYQTCQIHNVMSQCTTPHLWVKHIPEGPVCAY